MCQRKKKHTRGKVVDTPDQKSTITSVQEKQSLQT